MKCLACTECGDDVEFDACDACDGDGDGDECAECDESGAMDVEGVGVKADEVICSACAHADQMSVTAAWYDI